MFQSLRTHSGGSNKTVSEAPIIISSKDAKDFIKNPQWLGRSFQRVRSCTETRHALVLSSVRSQALNAVPEIYLLRSHILPQGQDKKRMNAMWLYFSAKSQDHRASRRAGRIESNQIKSDELTSRHFPHLENEDEVCKMPHGPLWRALKYFRTYR